MIKGVFFDLDNTLYDYYAVSEYAVLKSFFVVCRKVKISREEFLRIYTECKAEVRSELKHSPDSHDRILYFHRTCERLGLSVFDALRMYERYRRFFVKKMVARDGVKEVFRDIKKMGLKIVIVTNETLHIQLKKLIKLGVVKYVDYFVSSENVGVDKPNRKIFSYSLKKVGLSSSEVLMVGDSETDDVLGAARVGIKSVLLRTRARQRSGADYKISKITEVLKILESLKS